MYAFPDRTRSAFPPIWPQYPYDETPPTPEQSVPKYSIVTWPDLRAPMRDGVELAVDVYRPFGPGERFPALLAWTPYTKLLQGSSVQLGQNEAGITEFWVPRGYVHVIADARGTGDSGGKYDLLGPTEQHDIFDTINWIAEQPWCDGNVGMVGCSYFSMSQMAVAPHRPPHLKAIFPYDGETDLYREFFSRGGIPQGLWYVWVDTILTLQGSRTPDRSGIVQHLQDHLNLKYPLCGPYWEERSASPRLDKINIPCYFGCDWEFQEMHLRGAFESWERTKDIPKRMLIGPQIQPKRLFGGYAMEELRWYDHWLKGMDTRVMEGPPIRLWIPGDNRWRAENEWPIARTQSREVYLAVSTRGLEGALKDQPGPDKSLQYTFDPHDLGVLRGEPKLIFRSDPFERDTEITGHIALYLHASVNTPDTDFHVRILNEGSDGALRLLCKGGLRASHRELDSERSRPWQPYHPHTREVPLQPGEPFEFAIEMWPTSNVFKKGHKVRLEVGGSETLFEGLGLSRAGRFHALPPPRPCTVTVLTGKSHLSRLLLPFIPR